MQRPPQRFEAPPRRRQTAMLISSCLPGSTIRAEESSCAGPATHSPELQDQRWSSAARQFHRQREAGRTRSDDQGLDEAVPEALERPADHRGSPIAKAGQSSA